MNAPKLNAVNQENYHLLAGTVLGSLIFEGMLGGEEPRFSHALDKAGLCAYHFPDGRIRAAFDALSNLKYEGRTITAEQIVAEANGVVPLSYVSEILTLVRDDEFSNLRRFADDVDRLRAYGEAYATLQVIEGAATSIRNGDDVNFNVGVLMSTLATGNGTRVNDVSMKASLSRMRALLESPPQEPILTGFDIIDGATMGLLPAMYMGLAGAYKAGKTRTFYNTVLNAARQGSPAMIASLENMEEIITLQFVCMVAIEYILERVSYTASNPLFWISPSQLLIAKSTYKSWSALKVEAIDYAFRELEKLPIYVLDRSRENGGLSDIASVEINVARLRRTAGIKVLGIDHILLLGGAREEKDILTLNSNRLQKLARETKLSVIALAQLNEESVKSDSGYSAGVKGGGALSADVDVLVRVLPVLENDKWANDRAMLEVKFNRNGKTEAPTLQFFHPESGLRMGKQTLDLSEL